MKTIEKIGWILLTICLAWMTIQTIYGVGRAKGYVKARQEIEQEYQLSEKDKRELCGDLIQKAVDETVEEILGQF